MNKNPVHVTVAKLSTSVVPSGLPHPKKFDQAWDTQDYVSIVLCSAMPQLTGLHTPLPILWGGVSITIYWA